MGCATNGDETGELKEMGLCGSHAYSVLSVREVTLRDHGHFGGGGVRKERLVHVRNPHGVGEWNGDWSENSEKWSSVLRSEGSARGDFTLTNDRFIDDDFCTENDGFCTENDGFCTENR